METDKVMKKLIQDDFKKNLASDDFTNLVMAKVDVKQAEPHQPILKWYWLAIIVFGVVSIMVYYYLVLPVGNIKWLEKVIGRFSYLVNFAIENRMVITGIVIGLFLIIADQLYRRLKKITLLI